MNAIRQRCYNHAYLTIKGYNEYNNQVSASEKILEEDLEAAEMGNWFTKHKHKHRFIDFVQSTLISIQRHPSNSFCAHSIWQIATPTTLLPK